MTFRLDQFKFADDTMFNKDDDCLCIPLKTVRRIYNRLSEEDKIKYGNLIPSFGNWGYIKSSLNATYFDGLFRKSVNDISFIGSLKIIPIVNGKSCEVLFSGEKLQRWLEIENIV